MILNWKRTILVTLKIHRKQLGVTYSRGPSFVIFDYSLINTPNSSGVSKKQETMHRIKGGLLSVSLSIPSKPNNLMPNMTLQHRTFFLIIPNRKSGNTKEDSESFWSRNTSRGQGWLTQILQAYTCNSQSKPDPGDRTCTPVFVRIGFRWIYLLIIPRNSIKQLWYILRMQR